MTTIDHHQPQHQPITMTNYLAFSTAAFMAVTLWATPGHSREYQPGDSRLCEEIAHVLNDAYVDGHVTAEDAMEVIDTCFTYYE